MYIKQPNPQPIPRAIIRQLIYLLILPAKRIYIMMWNIANFIIPKQTLGYLINYCTRTQNPIIKNTLIKLFIKKYAPQLNLAESDLTNPLAYTSFNAFFTRGLKPNARSIDLEHPIIAAPVDGYVLQYGDIDGNKIQAKGMAFTLTELLANNHTHNFTNGAFITCYLAPYNYHRIHMPLDGTLEAMYHIPGKLFSVSPALCQMIPNIFARNERVLTIFNTAIGSVAIILVGAIFVGSIETTWHGAITPPYRNKLTSWDYTKLDQPIFLKKGAELGRFNMGSTVIILFEPNKINWHSNTLTALKNNTPINFGSPVAVINSCN